MAMWLVEIEAINLRGALLTSKFSQQLESGRICEAGSCL